MKIENLEKLFVDQLKDMYDAEHQLVDALGEMENKATSTQLKRAFAEHRKQTEQQAKKLERVFKALGEKPERKTCKAMKGLVAEGSELVKATGDRAAIDAGLIGAAQKVEHYEMATYGTLRTFARQLGRNQEAQLLQEILDEESDANEKLTVLATSGINQSAETGESRDVQSGLESVLGSLGLGGSKAGKGNRSTAERSASGARKSVKSSNGATRRATAKGSTSSRSAKSAARHTGGSTKGRGAQQTRTKQELLDEAKKLGIEGRTQMNKAQLAREVGKQRH